MGRPAVALPAVICVASMFALLAGDIHAADLRMVDCPIAPSGERVDSEALRVNVTSLIRPLKPEAVQAAGERIQEIPTAIRAPDPVTRAAAGPMQKSPPVPTALPPIAVAPAGAVIAPEALRAPSNPIDFVAGPSQRDPLVPGRMVIVCFQ
jgi:hypothetical protein